MSGWTRSPGWWDTFFALSVERSAPNAQRSTTVSDPLWYKDAIIYQTHVKSFRDENADGYGDFRGLTERLDYI